MTLDEMMVEQTVRARDGANEAQLRFAAEAVGQQHNALRARLASLLVRLGMWLDRPTAERTSRPAPCLPEGRALWD